MSENKKQLENKEAERVAGGDYPLPVKDKKCPNCGSTDVSAKPGTMGDVWICNECGTEFQIW